VDDLWAACGRLAGWARVLNDVGIAGGTTRTVFDPVVSAGLHLEAPQARMYRRDNRQAPEKRRIGRNRPSGIAGDTSAGAGCDLDVPETDHSDPRLLRGSLAGQ
jgi:hypothetical protein